MYSPLAIANTMILNGEVRDAMGLNKLVYITHTVALQRNHGI